MTPNYDALQLSPLAVILTVVFYAAVYVWLSFALARVFTKQGIPGWKAWVPVYSAMTFMKLGGQSVIWVFLAVLPLVGIVSAIFFIMALNGVTKRFGKGAGFTVLGVFFYGIWVSILGFGRAQAVDPNAAPVYEPITKVPYGAPPIAQPPRPTTPGVPMSTTPGVPISAAPVASSPAPPAPPVAPPVTAAPVTPFAPGLPSGPPPIISAAPGFSPPPPSTPPAQPLMQPYGQVPAQGNPWAPPGTPVSAAPVAPPAAPIIPVRAPVQPLPLDTSLDSSLDSSLDEDEGRTMLSGRAQHDDDDEGGEHTVIVGRRSKQWILTTDDGQNIRLSGSTVLLGRNPTRDRDYPDAQLVPLNDTAKTVSKTHARIELVNGAWQVVDLDSTNGVVLFMKNDEIELQPRVAAVLTERFLLGELPVRIHQES